MKIWEIKDIESGVKIKNKRWDDSTHFIYWDKSIKSFKNCHGELRYYAEFDEWEIFQEPKKTKIITLYRYTYRAFGGEFIQSSWTSEKASSLDDVAYKIIKTESKEVEVEE